MSLNTLRPPVTAWIVLILAAGTGVWVHLRNPMGIFLYIPRNWCEGRSHAFGAAFVSLLLVALALCVLLTAVTEFAKRLAPTARATSLLLNLRPRLLASGLLFLLGILLTPLIELALPLSSDPKCHSAIQHHP